MMTDRKALVWLLGSLLLVAIMPGSDSLWIDEGQTWLHVRAPTFGSWVASFFENQFSEALMPLGMFVAWAGARLVGTSEWQLRAVNLLWTGLAVVAFWRVGRRLQAPWAPMLFAVQPFVWFYTNEARPYALQIACGAWLLAGLVRAIDERSFNRESLLILATASMALVATTLFGILTVAGAGLVVIVCLWKLRWPLGRGWLVITIVMLTWCGLCGAYYVVMLMRGAEGARLWFVGPVNVAFSLYEFAGFTGFGPPRDELRSMAREGGMRQVVLGLKAAAPAILLLGTLLAIVLGQIALSIRRKPERPMTAAMLVVLGVACGSTLLLAMVAHFPFWGRHLAPSFPFFVGLLILGGRSFAESPRFILRLILPSLLALCLVSSLRLRFSPEHGKDDYRGASALARQAISNGRTVWWVADEDLGIYYGVPFWTSGETTASGRAVLLAKTRPGTLPTGSAPDLVILTKPDVYDEHHVIRNVLESSSMKAAGSLKSFVLWEAGNQGASPP